MIDKHHLEQSLEQIRAMVASFLRGHQADVYLFALQAQQTACRASDIDIAINPL